MRNQSAAAANINMMGMDMQMRTTRTWHPMLSAAGKGRMRAR